MALPMGGLAVLLDLVEDRLPALQDVTKATQKSVLTLLGGKFKPLLGIVIALALGTLLHVVDMCTTVCIGAPGMDSVLTVCHFCTTPSYSIGFAAGFGEEMLFRGVMQYGLTAKLGTAGSLAVVSIIFGALHAVTPLYALLAGIASTYFGYLYLSFGNLAVPIYAHALYDVGALYYAHWVSGQKMCWKNEANLLFS